jgi:hypothetical protein
MTLVVRVRFAGCYGAGRSHRRARQVAAVADAEKAAGHYTVGFCLRLPARFPVPSRSTPSLHRHS